MVSCDSCLMLQKMRVFLKLRFLASSRSFWSTFKWLSRSTILVFNESMSNVCDVIFWVFSEIRGKLYSPCLIAWMTDFSTAVIEFPMLTNWEDTLFSTDVIFCITLTNFSSMGFLSPLIRLTGVLVALTGWESLFVFDILNFFLYKDNLKSLC